MSQIEAVGSAAVGTIPPGMTQRPGMDLATARRAALSQLRGRLRTEPGLIASLWAELASPDRIARPDLTLFYGTLSYAGRVYTILEYVSGETLEELVKRADPGEMESATPLFCRVLDAFEESDRKAPLGLPSSFADSGVVLTDFGVCRVSCETWGRSYGTLLITPGGISPEEIIREDQTSRQHILSLLLAACQSLLGQAPPSVEATPGTLNDIFIAPVGGRPRAADFASRESAPTPSQTPRFRIPSALIALATAVLVLAGLFVGARLMSRIVPKQSAIALPPSPALDVEVRQSPGKPEPAAPATRQRVSSPPPEQRPSNTASPIGRMSGTHQQVAAPTRGSS